MIVLLDLDDTMTDWTGRLDKGLDVTPSLAHVPRGADRTAFDLMHGLDKDQQKTMRGLLDEAEFYRHLEPLPGAVESFRHLIEAGHDVFIVSTPWRGNHASPAEKTMWVDEHMGDEGVKRLILTHDKTLVHGDVLVDDKPVITGVMRPHWTRIMFNQPHNAAVDYPLRLNGWDRLTLALHWAAHCRTPWHDQKNQPALRSCEGCRGYEREMNS
jgi:5'-nucleotidase